MKSPRKPGDPYDVAEAARRLRTSPWSIYRLVRNGHLARIPHLGHVLIAEAEMDRFIALGVLDADPTPAHGIERPVLA